MNNKIMSNKIFIRMLCFFFIFSLSIQLMSQTKAPKTTIHFPKAELSISYFGKKIAPGTMRAQVRGGSSTAVPTYRINAGETFTFSWAFRTKNALSISAKLVNSGGQTTLNPGTPVVLPNGWKSYRNQRNKIIRSAGEYTLKIIAISRGGNAVKEKKIQFIVSSPSLKAISPVVNAASRVVTFKVKNEGNATAAGRFKVYYQIQGRNPRRSLVQSNFTTDLMEIRKNRTAVLGQITLPESAWQSAQVWMRVKIDQTGRVTSTTGNKDFTYNWPLKTFKITNSLVDIFVRPYLSGQIKLNNYTNPSRSKIKNLPYRRDDCEVEIMGKSEPFHFGYFKYDVGFSYYFFIRNFTAEIGGRNFLTIEGGKLCLSISFNCSAGREVKGWRRRPTFKDYSDDGCPDLDIQRFNIKVTVEPKLRGNKISYRNAQVAVDSAMRIPGGWSWLNGFKGKINSSVQSSVRKAFKTQLNNTDIKTTLEDKLTKIIMDNADTLGVHKIVSVRGIGDEVIVKYR